MRITIEVTPEQLEIIADGLSAARCGMDSLVKNAEVEEHFILAPIYSAWRDSFMLAEKLIPQNVHDERVTL